jgi:hypothetical protein
LSIVFFIFFSVAHSPLPTDNNSIPHPTLKYNWHNAQISGKIFVQIADKILLDKLLKGWYNGNSRRMRSPAARAIK